MSTKTMNRPTHSNWPAGLAAALFLFGMWHLATDADPQPTAAASAEALSAELDVMDARIQRAARDLCTDALGPGTEALWTADGDLVCRPATLTAGGSAQ